MHPSGAGVEHVPQVGSQSTQALLYNILSDIQEVHVVRLVAHDLHGEVHSSHVSPCSSLPLEQAVQVVPDPSHVRQLMSHV